MLAEAEQVDTMLAEEEALSLVLAEVVGRSQWFGGSHGMSAPPPQTEPWKCKQVEILAFHLLRKYNFWLFLIGSVSRPDSGAF